MMSGYRDVLERSRRVVGPSRLQLDVVYGRRDRRRRNQRIGAAVCAMAIAVAGLGFIVRAFERSQPVPANRITQESVSRLQLAWTAEVPHLAGGAPVITRGNVLVRSTVDFTRAGIIAYPVNCARSGGTCRPGWLGRTGGEVGQPAAGNGEIFAMGADCTPHGGGARCFGRIYAFPSTCSGDGSTCDPLWTADGVRGAGGVERSIPLPSGVLVGSSFYPATCSGDGCHPTWVDRHWSASQDGFVLGQEVVMPENGRIAAYPVACVVSGGCDPSWTAALPGDATVTAVGDGVAVWNSDGRVAFYRGCKGGAPCRPAWTTTAASRVGLPGCTLSSIAEASGTVFLTSGACGISATLAAYPLDCRTDGRECAPSWTHSFPNIDSMVAADGNVYVTSGGLVSTFPATCSTPPRCDPTWVGQGDRMPVDPVAGGGLVWVMSGADLLVYANDCGTGGTSCEPLWRQDIGADAVWVAIDGPTLYVAGGGQLSAWDVDGG